VHLVGFTIEIYHDARPYERQALHDVLKQLDLPVEVQPTLGYHITNRQSRYMTPARLKSAYTTQQIVASS